jgi:hypothetical protein
VRIGAPDLTLTPVSGMLAVAELCERLDVVGRLDTAIGSIKLRRRGHTAGEVLVGIGAAQLAGEDFLVGLDRQRADAVGQQLAPVPGLAATTAAGLAGSSPTGSGWRWRPGSVTCTPPRWPRSPRWPQRGRPRWPRA